MAEFAKRRRVPFQRPKEVKIIAVDHIVQDIQTSTTLFTTTFPFTLSLLSWTLSIITLSQSPVLAGPPYTTWSIVRVRDGESATVMNRSNGAIFYKPEVDLIALGSLRTEPTGARFANITGNTDRTIQMHAGDTLQFISIDNFVNGALLRGIITWTIQ